MCWMSNQIGLELLGRLEEFVDLAPQIEQQTQVVVARRLHVPVALGQQDELTVDPAGVPRPSVRGMLRR
jgi:hypothetical protein